MRRYLWPVCAYLLAYGQVSPPKGVSRRAYETFLEAVRLAQARRSAEALAKLQFVLAQEPTYEDAWILKGKLHLERREYGYLQETGEKLRALRSLSPAGRAWALYFLGKAYTAQMAYDSAAAIWKEFVVAAVGHLPTRLQDEGALLLSQTASAAQLLKNPVPFAPKNLGPAVNSPGEEYLPSLTADGQRLFFTSRRPKPATPPRTRRRRRPLLERKRFSYGSVEACPAHGLPYQFPAQRGCCLLFLRWTMGFHHSVR